MLVVAVTVVVLGAVLAVVVPRLSMGRRAPLVAQRVTAEHRRPVRAVEQREARPGWSCGLDDSWRG
jgi:hypothetical protein